MVYGIETTITSKIQEPILHLVISQDEDNDIHMEDLLLAEEKIKIYLIRIKAQKRNIQLFHKKKWDPKVSVWEIGFYAKLWGIRYKILLESLRTHMTNVTWFAISLLGDCVR